MTMRKNDRLIDRSVDQQTLFASFATSTAHEISHAPPP